MKPPGDDHDQRKGGAEAELGNAHGERFGSRSIGLWLLWSRDLGGWNRRRRQKADDAEDQLHPYKAAEDMTRADPGLRQQRHLRLQRVTCAHQDYADSEVGDRSGKRQDARVARCFGLARRARKGHDAANGKKEDGAQLQACISSSDGPRDLAHEDGEAESQPQSDAARRSAIEGLGEEQADHEQQRERDVQTQLNVEESAKGDGRTQHPSIVGAREDDTVENDEEQFRYE
jgi:hypothetical protein